MKQVFLAVRSTQMQPDEENRIYEIGAYAVSDRKPSDEPCDYFHLYVNPECELTVQEEKTGHVRNAFLAKQPTFAQIAEKLLQFLEGAVLVGHDIQSTIALIDAELKRIGKGDIEDRCLNTIDTRELAAKFFPGREMDASDLIDNFGCDVPVMESFAAMYESRGLAEAYLEMTKEDGSLNINYAQSIHSIMSNAGHKAVRDILCDFFALESYATERYVAGAQLTSKQFECLDKLIQSAKQLDKTLQKLSQLTLDEGEQTGLIDNPLLEAMPSDGIDDLDDEDDLDFDEEDEEDDEDFEEEEEGLDPLDFLNLNSDKSDKEDDKCLASIRQCRKAALKDEDILIPSESLHEAAKVLKAKKTAENGFEY